MGGVFYTAYFFYFSRSVLHAVAVQLLGPLTAGARGEIVLIGYVGWMACLEKPPPTTAKAALLAAEVVGPNYHFKASTIVKYAKTAKRVMEEKCGLAFGGGYVPSLVRFPRVCRGLVSFRGETPALERLAIAPQHLLQIAEFLGIVLEVRAGRGPHTYPRDEQQTKLALFGACLDGFLLTMRCMEFTSKSASKFVFESELCRGLMYGTMRTVPEDGYTPRGTKVTRRSCGRRKSWR
jgi:hypothetical protein